MREVKSKLRKRKRNIDKKTPQIYKQIFVNIFRLQNQKGIVIVYDFFSAKSRKKLAHQTDKKNEEK